MAGFVPVETDLMTIEELEAGGLWPVEWTSVLGLIPYIKRQGPDLIGLEIGVARGESSYVLLDKCPNIKTLYGIDPYKEFEDWVGTIDQEHNDKTKEIAIKNLAKFGDRFVSLFTMDSKDALLYDGFDDNYFDFIFIDGDHSFDGALFDIANYYDKVKVGGIFAGHDYNLPAVQEALIKFRNDTKIRTPINITSNNCWYWIKT